MVKPKSWVLFVSAFCAGIVATAFVRWPPHQSSDWAAWVQAIGSIGAVGVAIYISWAQAKNDRDRERARAAAENDGILMNVPAVLQNAAKIIDEMPDSTASDPVIERYLKEVFSRAQFAIATQALAAIELHRLKWWRAVELVLEMRQLFSDADVVVNTLNSDFANRERRPEWRKGLDKIGNYKRSSADIASNVNVLRLMVAKVGPF